ncbi:MAG: NAD-dependent deacylase [Elsteraceae bacterium]
MPIEIPKLSPTDGLVILTGAGVSAESGLATFRDADGIWSKVRIEDVATPEAFARDPARVQEFYNARRRQLRDPAVQPNAAHRALAELDAAWPGPLLLVTQNVDDLHRRAGSKRMLAMHGQLASRLCANCEERVPWIEDLTVEMVCPRCGGRGSLRPDIVWFGEAPYGMEEIEEALAGARIFAAIGTSGQVYPAAGFVALAQRAGALTIELNLEPSEGGRRFQQRRYGPATEIVPEFVAALLKALTS